MERQPTHFQAIRAGGLMVLVCSLLVVAGCQSSTPPPKTPQKPVVKDPFRGRHPKETVLTVDGKSYSLEAITQHQGELMAERGYTAPSESPASAYWFRLAARSLIMDDLFISIAKKKGVTVSPEELEERLQQIQRETMSPQTLSQSLQLKGLNDELFRQKAKDFLMVQKLIEVYLKERPPRPVRDEDRRQYEQNKEKFRLPRRVRLSHILIRCLSRTECLAKGNKLRASIVGQKMDFRDAVLAHSQDGKTREQGGDLGWLREGTFNMAIEAEAMELDVGEISKPILTEQGVEIVKVMDKRPEGIASFDEVQELLNDFNLSQARQSAMRRLEKEAETSAKVVISKPFKKDFPGGLFAPMNAPPEDSDEEEPADAQAPLTPSTQP